MADNGQPGSSEHHSHPPPQPPPQDQPVKANHKVSCGECGKELSAPSALDRHRALYHKDERPYPCPFQGCKHATEGFKIKEYLNKHIKRHHANLPAAPANDIALHQAEAEIVALNQQLQAETARADQYMVMFQRSQTELDQARIELDYQRQGIEQALRRHVEEMQAIHADYREREQRIWGEFDRRN